MNQRHLIMTSLTLGGVALCISVKSCSNSPKINGESNLTVFSKKSAPSDALTSSLHQSREIDEVLLLIQENLTGWENDPNIWNESNWLAKNPRMKGLLAQLRPRLLKIYRRALDSPASPASNDELRDATILTSLLGNFIAGQKRLDKITASSPNYWGQSRNFYNRKEVAEFLKTRKFGSIEAKKLSLPQAMLTPFEDLSKTNNAEKKRIILKELYESAAEIYQE